MTFQLQNYESFNVKYINLIYPYYRYYKEDASESYIEIGSLVTEFAYNVSILRSRFVSGRIQPLKRILG